MERLERDNRELRNSLLMHEAGFTAPPGPTPLPGYGGAINANEDMDVLESRVTALEGKAAPKLPLIKLGGFFQLDNAWFSQDSQSRAAYGDIQDGTGFRRARMQAYGSVTEHTNYIIEMDFATAGRPSFLDVWGEQTEIPWLGTIRIGQFRQPTTMDAWTSVRHLEFMERSNPFQALDPFRRVGIMAYNNSPDKRYMWAYSLYRSGFTFFNPVSGSGGGGELGDTRYGTFIGDNGGWALAFRGTGLIYDDECDPGCRLLHVGLGYNWDSIGGNGKPPGGINGGQYVARTIPGVFVGAPELAGLVLTGTPFMSNTGAINASYFEFAHAELAGQYGSAHFQSEVMFTGLKTDNYGYQSLGGWYAQGGYFLTGERCGYNKVMGVFDYNVKPNNPNIGAWEVAYQFAYTDLPNIGQTPVAPPANAGTGGANPNPGQLYSNTIALNWWWNQYARVQFNYINSYLESDFYGTPHTHAFATRFQVEF